MKFLIVLVAIFGLVICDPRCPSPTKPSLEDDFNDITKLIPSEKIKAVAHKYSNDSDVLEILKFIQGSTFASTFNYVLSQKAVLNLFSFLCANGVSIVEHLNRVNGLLGLPEINLPPSVRSSPSTRTFKDLLEEVEALLPLTQMKVVFEQKKATSQAFKTLYDTINSKEFHDTIADITALPSNQQGNAVLAQHGVSDKDLFRVIQELLGWVETYSLTVV